MTKTKTSTTHSAATQTADTAPASPAITEAARKSAKSAGARTSALNQADTTATAATAPTGAPPPRQTKAALLRRQLAEPGGASLATLMEATGWQAHTLRAALSGMRKAGVTLTRRREGTDTIYAIAATGDAPKEPTDNGEGDCAEPDNVLSTVGDRTTGTDLTTTAEPAAEASA